MKSTIVKILGIAGTFVFMTLWLSNCHNLTAELKQVTAERDQAVQDYESCKNAKIYVDTSKVVTDHIIEYVEVPTPYEVIKYDTIYIDSIRYVYPVQLYSDTLKTDDFDLFWRAEGIIDKIEFPYYRLYDETITESHVIEKVRTEYKYSPESALYLYMKFGTQDFRGLNGVGVGLDYTSKKGWGILAEYQRMSKMNFYLVGVKLRLL